MFWRLCLILFIGILLEWKLTLSAPAEIGKTKGKGRAYEFGFSIEEQQHRHEKRDENGIVMGEFGFITADGIYHVTVYATDENGKFKIISMKNYPYGNAEKKIMIAMLPPSSMKPVVKPTVIKAMMPDGKSCGGCVLPKKSNLLPADVMGKKPGDEKLSLRPLPKDLNGMLANDKTNLGRDNPTTQSKTSTSGSLPLPQVGKANGKGSSAVQQPKVSGSGPLIPPNTSTSGAQKPSTIGTPSSKLNPKIEANNEAKTSTTNTQSTNNKSPAAPSSQNMDKTSSSGTSGGSGKVGGGGSGGDGGGGPLYRFKYVLDYNSHSEEGHANGAKEGKYDTIYEDGIRRIIDYIANENGYQPHIKLERLPPNELPTGENKLKEYEFVWFN